MNIHTRDNCQVWDGGCPRPHGNSEGRYLVKCHDCKATMRRTDDVRESYAGGRCEQCRKEEGK